MTLHLIGFPHTRLDGDFTTCAYTQKVSKWARMMAGRGHDLIVYHADSPALDGAELVPVLSEEERLAIFGPDDRTKPPAWPTDEQWAPFNLRAAEAIRERSQPGDLLLLFGGLSQKPIGDQLPHLIACEPGVGYEGTFTAARAYESHAWRHYSYGKQGVADGRWFDTVIPNYFDLAEFPLDTVYGDGYLLFVGRIIPRKGPQIALEIARTCGLPLVVAGPGVTHASQGLIVAGEGTPDHVRLEGDVTYAGVLGIQERAIVMAGARALLAPTTYIEPFGGVSVEAMLAGTPAITSDWGAFAETVIDGITGFTFGTLAEAVQAVERAADLSPAVIRARTAARYSLDAVAPLYDRWLERVGSLYEGGWYELPTRLEAVA